MSAILGGDKMTKPKLRSLFIQTRWLSKAKTDATKAKKSIFPVIFFLTTVSIDATDVNFTAILREGVAYANRRIQRCTSPSA